MNFRNTVFYLGVPLILFAVTGFLVRRPYYNWDLIPYMTLTEASDSKPFDSTYYTVVNKASQEIPGSVWPALRDKHPELTGSPDSLKRILVYFEIKPLFIYTTRFFRALGFKLFASTFLPSIVSYFLITVTLFFWMVRLLPLLLASLFALVISSFPFLLEPARLSSPDMLCALFLFTGLFLATEFSLIAGLIVSWLALFIRPDAFLFVMPLLVALNATGKIKNLPTVLLALTFMATAFLITGPGLTREFLFTTQDYSTGWSISEMTSVYQSSLWHGTFSILHSYVLAFIFIAFFTLKTGINNDSSRFWTFLVGGTLISFVLRYLLHPVIEDRFLIASYLLIVIAFCRMIKHMISGSGLVQRSKLVDN